MQVVAVRLQCARVNALAFLFSSSYVLGITQNDRKNTAKPLLRNCRTQKKRKKNDGTDNS